MGFMKNVYVVDAENARVLDYAPNIKSLEKRISLKKEPYPEGSVFVSVAKTCPLTCLETEEQQGYYFLERMIATSVITGVPVKEALDRLSA